MPMIRIYDSNVRRLQKDIQFGNQLFEVLSLYFKYTVFGYEIGIIASDFYFLIKKGGTL